MEVDAGARAAIIARLSASDGHIAPTLGALSATLGKIAGEGVRRESEKTSRTRRGPDSLPHGLGGTASPGLRQRGRAPAARIGLGRCRTKMGTGNQAEPEGWHTPSERDRKTTARSCFEGQQQAQQILEK